MEGSAHSEVKKWVRRLSDPKKRERAKDELLRLGGEAAPALIEGLRSKASYLPSLAETLLVQIGPAATPALTTYLQCDDPELRSQCAQILAQVKDPQASTVLVKALKDQSFRVREKAAMALGEIRNPKTLPALMSVLSDPEPEVRSSVLLAIGQFCDSTAFDRMADLLLEDPHLEVRQDAARALGGTRLEEALPYLMVALRDSFWWYERETAVDPLLEAIEHIGFSAVESLLEVLHDPEGTVRKFAAFLLGRIGDERAIQSLEMVMYDMHYEVGQTAAESLARFGEKGLKVLAGALVHPEAWIRQHAVRGLMLSRDKRVVPELVKLLEDPAREVVCGTIQSLGSLGDSRALPALQKIASDRTDRELSTLARQAIKALAADKK